jgi:formate/nitrite transporter FocA (FNT family)
MKQSILKALLAGILIGFGAYAYVSLFHESRFLGACLFSLGLISVFHLQADLYTGKIGQFPRLKAKSLGLMLLFNFIGISLLAITVLGNNQLVEKCMEIASKKISISIPTALIMAILCGMIIQLAVDIKKEGPIATILSIMLFILCGFEHCVANIFYFVGSSVFRWQYVLYIVIYIIGNSCGGILMRILIERSRIDENN